MDNRNSSPKEAGSASPLEQPTQTIPTPPADNKDSHKTIRYLLVALAVVIVAAGVYAGFWYYQQAYSPKQTSKTNTVSQAVQVSHPSPPTTSAALGTLPVKYVTLPLTSDQAATDPVKGPAQMITTASGHYLLRDLRGSSYAHHNTGGKLLYDGQAIYDGPYLWTFALSQNGEHYLYTLDTATSTSNGNIEVYIDGKLVQSFAESKWLFYPQVSNDGQHYAYVTGALGTDIVKDGTAIYTNSYVETAFSADLSKYIAATQRNTDYFNVIVNGTQVASHVTFLGNNALFAISNNGQHYIYRNGNSLYEDGKEVAASKSIDATAITDTGTYAIADLASNNVDINGKSNTIPAELTQGCTPNCVYNPSLQLAINPSGSHYIIGTQQLPFWDLDGAQVSPTGNIEGVEFVGTTLYLYRWAQ